MHIKNQEKIAGFLIWWIPAMWSVNYWVAKNALGIIDPYLLALGRWALAGSILVLISRHDIWQHRHHIQSVWHQYVVLGTLGMLICGAWVYLGARTTTAVNISLIYAVSPVLIAVSSVWVLKERMVARQVLGVVIALVGVLHVVAKGQWFTLAQVEWVMGDFWILSAACSWSAYAVLQKKWTSPLGSTARLACMCMGGILTLIPFTLWELTWPNSPPFSWTALVMIVIVALIPGIGAYGIYGWSQKVLGASRVSVTLYLSPLWGAFIAWVALNESLYAYHLIGAFLILPGVALVMRKSTP